MIFATPGPVCQVNEQPVGFQERSLIPAYHSTHASTWFVEARIRLDGNPLPD